MAPYEMGILEIISQGEEMGKKIKTKDVYIDADHILYEIASPPAKAFKSSLGGKSLKQTDAKGDLKKLKRAFKDRVDEYTKIAEVQSIAYDWTIGDTHVIISDKSNFRYDVFPAYKADRKGRPVTEHFASLRKWARKKFAPKQHIEADDVVAYWIAKGAIGFSGDKDILRGVAGMMFDTYYSRRHWVYTSDEEARRFNLIQYVMGDLGDGIVGIDGVAEITAIKLLDEHGWNWQGVVQSYFAKGYTAKDAILTRRLTSLKQWHPKKGLKLFNGE